MPVQAQLVTVTAPNGVTVTLSPATMATLGWPVTFAEPKPGRAPAKTAPAAK